MDGRRSRRALRLLVQLPYRSSTLILVKLGAVLAAWVMVSIPALSALAIWATLGGHLAASETLNLLFGHLLYGLLVGAVALFAATISESSATAAILCAGRDHRLLGALISPLPAIQACRPGSLSLADADSAPVRAGTSVRWTGAGYRWCDLRLSAAPRERLAASPASHWRTKLMRSLACVLATAAALTLATQIGLSVDVTQDRRNSFPVADQRLLAALKLPLVVRVNLVPEDPRYLDLQRNVLAKLDRAMPNVSIVVAQSGRNPAGNSGDSAYGEIEYAYGGRSDVSRSTSPREILPLLYALAGVQPPPPGPGDEYPGYPLIARADARIVVVRRWAAAPHCTRLVVEPTGATGEILFRTRGAR